MATQLSEAKSSNKLVITWEALPKDFQLEDEPVENTGQPILAGALRESLEISGFIQPQMLIASNFGLCATVNEQFIVKAPDWVYIPSVNEVVGNRKSYTSNLEGDIPAKNQGLLRTSFNNFTRLTSISALASLIVNKRV